MGIRIDRDAFEGQLMLIEARCGLLDSAAIREAWDDFEADGTLPRNQRLAQACLEIQTAIRVYAGRIGNPERGNHVHD